MLQTYKEHEIAALKNKVEAGKEKYAEQERDHKE
jgi:hypothetical protein